MGWKYILQSFSALPDSDYWWQNKNEGSIQDLFEVSQKGNALSYSRSAANKCQ